MKIRKYISDPRSNTRNLLQSNFHSLHKDWIFRNYLSKILEHKNWKPLWSHCVQLRSLGGIQVQFFGPPMIWGFPSNLSYEVRLYTYNQLCVIAEPKLTRSSEMWRHRLVGSKVHIFWEGHKIFRNLHLTFYWHCIGQKLVGDFAKLWCLLRIYELYIHTYIIGGLTSFLVLCFFLEVCSMTYLPIGF